MPPIICFFFSSRRRHTRCGRDWSSDVCSSDLASADQRRSTVETALHDIVRNIPHVLIIWLALVALTLIGCGFLAVPTLQRRYRAGKARAAAAQVRRVQLGAQAEELRRLADELAVAAARSRVTTQRQEDEWEG